MIERAFIQQNLKKIELEQFIKRQIDRAGFTKLDIVKTPLVTRIIINVTHPGLAIGKSGQNIKRLTLEIAEKFGIENPQLEIQEIKVPELDAKAMVDKIKTLIERGYSWRSIAFRTVQDISSKGAQGVELVLSGALGGKGERKRQQRIATGYMKKTGDQVKLVDFAKITSYPKYGAIGIKLRIVHPDTVFPDKINIREILNPKIAEPEKEEKKEESQKAEEEKPLGLEVEKIKEEEKTEHAGKKEQEAKKESEKKHEEKSEEEKKPGKKHAQTEEHSEKKHDGEKKSPEKNEEKKHEIKEHAGKIAEKEKGEKE
jgi:small subunit ribosomal protein S3